MLNLLSKFNQKKNPVIEKYLLTQKTGVFTYLFSDKHPHKTKKQHLTQTSLDVFSLPVTAPHWESSR